LATVTVDGSFALEQSPFDIVQVDVTHRCNMACSNCYIPNRDVPDLDAEWILRMLARLPPRRNIRLVGAEPTMRSDLPELIARVRELGHHVSILTNGLTIARREYLRELKDAGLRVVYLSMNGGCDDDAYEVVDGLRCAKKKIQAFENLAAEHMYSSIGIIVVPGVNEAQVGNLFRASAQNRGMRELHVRGVGAIGRHMDAPNQLKLEALREIVATQTGVAERRPRARRRIVVRRLRHRSPPHADHRMAGSRQQAPRPPDARGHRGPVLRARDGQRGRVLSFGDAVLALATAVDPTREPFFVRLARGEYTPASLAVYALRTQDLTIAFPKNLRRMIAMAADPEAVKLLTDSLDEEVGRGPEGRVEAARSHLFLARRFVNAVGGEVEVERATENRWTTELLEQNRWLEALACFGLGFEANVSRSYVPLVAALSSQYGLSSEALEFFTLHITADAEHGARTAEVLARCAVTPEQQAAVSVAARRGAAAWWQFHRACDRAMRTFA